MKRCRHNGEALPGVADRAGRENGNTIPCV
nr:MAG TPA: hypothetical protein [Caudoviricetes sp.]